MFLLFNDAIIGATLQTISRFHAVSTAMVMSWYAALLTVSALPCMLAHAVLHHRNNITPYLLTVYCLRN